MVARMARSVLAGRTSCVEAVSVDAFLGKDLQTRSSCPRDTLAAAFGTSWLTCDATAEEGRTLLAEGARLQSPAAASHRVLSPQGPKPIFGVCLSSL